MAKEAIESAGAVDEAGKGAQKAVTGAGGVEVTGIVANEVVVVAGGDASGVNPYMDVPIATRAGAFAGIVSGLGEACTNLEQQA